MSTQRLIRMKHVCETTGLARGSVYHLMRQNEFPQPVKIGKRAIAFSEQAVQDWIVAKIKSAI